jgi:hypothetical protein
MNVRNPVSVLQFTTDDLTSYTRRKFYSLKIRAWWYTTILACTHACNQLRHYAGRPVPPPALPQVNLVDGRGKAGVAETI